MANRDRFHCMGDEILPGRRIAGEKDGTELLRLLLVVAKAMALGSGWTILTIRESITSVVLRSTDLNALIYR